MEKFPHTARWIPETDGERLFLGIYKFVAPTVPELFVGQSWLVSSDGMTEHLRLMASIELTHRCLNTSVALYKNNQHASINPLVHRLRLNVGIQKHETLLQLAQSARLAALAYINRNLNRATIDEIHRNEQKKCCWCGITTVRKKKAGAQHMVATIEHLWPEFLGGTSDPENLTIACDACNTARRHSFSWAWFATQSINEKPDAHGSLPLEIRLAVALYRLMKVASGQTPISAERLTLKDAALRLQFNGVIPKFNLEPDCRYTFFELLNSVTEEDL